MKIEIVKANYENPQHASDIIFLLSQYAEDPMGGGQPLAQYSKENLAKSLARIPGAVSLLAYADNQPAGLLNAFEGFSTFKCKPLFNIHDLAVMPSYRRHGIARQLLAAMQREALERGCCKLTLEVLTGNDAARQAYEACGFKGYELDPKMGQALFLEKAF